MPVPTNDTLFQGDHKGVTNDPNLFSLSDIAAAMGTDSLAISATTSKVISTAAASALDSAPVSTASSKATSAASQASIADSKAVSGSLNTSTVDSKAASGSVNTSIADSKATSVATALIIPAVNSLPGFLLPLTGASIRTANAKMADAWSLADFGAIGNGVADDTTAIQTALTAADGGVLMGVPGKTYKVSGQLVPPTNLVFDLNGATLKPTGTVDMLYKARQTASATATVTGATQGAIRLTLSSMTGFTAGSVVWFSTNYAVTMPTSWSVIKSLDAAASQIILDSPLPFTYAGTVTVNQQPLYGTLIIENGNIDLSSTASSLASPITALNLSGYTKCILRGLHFTGGGPALGSITTCMTVVQCRHASVEDCTAIDVVLGASVVSMQDIGTATVRGLNVDGDCFGTICVACDVDSQSDVHVRGRYKSTDPDLRSVRAVKSSSCRHTTYDHITVSDMETAIEIFNCARVMATNISATNMGLRTYNGQNVITYAATLADGYMEHFVLDGFNFDNIGGNGVQTAVDTTGRVTIANGTMKSVGATALLVATQNTRLSNLTIEDWNTLTTPTSGTGAIISTSATVSTIIDIDGVTAIHNTDTAKPILTLTAGPQYIIRGVASPTGNTLYDTALGIDLGAQNIYIGTMANVRRTGSVAHVAGIGAMEYFTVGNGKSFVFITRRYGKFFQIESGTSGTAAIVSGDNASATLTLLSNPSSLFVNSAAPGGGLIGVSKAINSDTITVKNNTGGTQSIGICLFGDTVITTSDPA